MFKFLKKIFIYFLLFLVAHFAISFWILELKLKTRYPSVDFSRVKFGKASWYSMTDKGILPTTANGEKFNDKKLTCASWDYPFGQRLIVINLVTHKWVACRVNDRGPHKRLRRAVDLTKTTFSKIANLKEGLVFVAIVPAGKYELKKS